MASERERIGAARRAAAMALAMLTHAAEWLDEAVDCGAVHDGQLTELRDQLWAMTHVARDVEHDLATIHTVERQTAH